MKNKIVVLVILGSLVVSMFTGCRQSSSKYISQVVDSISNDKDRLGLNGKVKTLDIYYYYPENTSSFFSTKFKKGEKWEEDGIYHYHLQFNIDGNLVQSNECDEHENVIRQTNYTYETWGYTRTLISLKSNDTIVCKYNTDRQLLEVVDNNLDGEINTYDDKGNLIRTKQIDGTISKPAMIEYDYNEHNLLVEKREFYNIGELSGKTVYEYDINNLLVKSQVSDLLSDVPETHFLYEYSDSNRMVEEYRIDDEGNKKLESWCKREYYPNGKLKSVVRNSLLQEEYDEQGRLMIDKRPGFEILYKDFQDYDYDTNGNWIETNNFKDYVDFGTGLGRILKPYVERVFTYYEE